MRSPLLRHFITTSRRDVYGLSFAVTRQPGATTTIPHARWYSVTPKKPHHKFAFAFDIDGVLLHGSRAIPAAKRALSLLNQHNIHYIFLTNGGGKSEHSRVLQLSEKLGFPFSDKQIVQSHTPFRIFATGERGPVYDMLTKDDPDSKKINADTTVLVVGGEEDKAKHVARQYGFKDALTSYDLLVTEPALWPFTEITDHIRSFAEPWKKVPKVGAIFVFNDPRDWGLDTQVIVDLLLSRGGELGTRSEKNGFNGEWQNDGQPALFFGCDDLFWANEYSLNRLGQGAYRKALEGVWREITGTELMCTVIGKPHEVTYAYAEGILSHWRSGAISGEREPLERIYMVGDNPESDIRGANEFESSEGTEWRSLLVKTGVYKGGEPSYIPTQIVNDVEHAVKWALAKEGCLEDGCVSS